MLSRCRCGLPVGLPATRNIQVSRRRGPPALAEFSLRFGPPEFFWVGIFGLTLIATLASGSLWKALAGGALGIGMLGRGGRAQQDVKGAVDVLHRDVG